jgi:hypothetical protein
MLRSPLPCESWRHMDPAGFDLRLIGADGFGADVLHQHVDVLQECGWGVARAHVCVADWRGRLGRVHRGPHRLRGCPYPNRSLTPECALARG